MMQIESCNNTDAHPDHHWGITAWCPGATAAPKRPKEIWVVTVHSGHGSMAEAADAQLTYQVDREANAIALTDGLNNLFSNKGADDYWALYTKAELPPEIGPNSIQEVQDQLAEEIRKNGPLKPDQLAIDLYAILAELDLD